MNIIVLHQDEIVLTKIKALSKIKMFNFLYINNFEKFIELVDIQKIDFLIIDLSDKSFSKIMDDILNIVPNIKTININSEPYESIDCDICIDKYQRRRLLNNFDVIQLNNIINNFMNNKCIYYRKFKNVKEILIPIMKQFIYHEYIENTNQIICKKNNVFVTNELLKIMDLLNKKEIQFKMINENNIQIL